MSVSLVSGSVGESVRIGRLAPLLVRLPGPAAVPVAEDRRPRGRRLAEGLRMADPVARRPSQDCKKHDTGPTMPRPGSCPERTACPEMARHLGPKYTIRHTRIPQTQFTATPKPVQPPALAAQTLAIRNPPRHPCPGLRACNGLLGIVSPYGGVTSDVLPPGAGTTGNPTPRLTEHSVCHTAPGGGAPRICRFLAPCPNRFRMAASSNPCFRPASWKEQAGALEAWLIKAMASTHSHRHFFLSLIPRPHVFTILAPCPHPRHRASPGLEPP